MLRPFPRSCMPYRVYMLHCIGDIYIHIYVTLHHMQLQQDRRLHSSPGQVSPAVGYEETVQIERTKHTNVCALVNPVPGSVTRVSVAV